MGAPVPAPPPRPTFAHALAYWWKLGWISFGGPAGQIAIMHHDLVERRRWISEARFLHALNYCMVLPGPEAQQLATYIGWLMHRTRGGIAAGALFVLPSLAVLIALSWLYMAYGKLPLISGALYGIKPAVTAIVLHAAWRIGSRTLRSPTLIAVAAAAFIAIAGYGVAFPWIILTAAAIGAVGARVAPSQFLLAGAHRAADVSTHPPAVIDDDTPPPAHARFSIARLTMVAIAGLALWAATLTAIVIATGRDSTLAHMAWFFTKAALLTFGGAYAVLPYVVQAAVDNFGWLTPAQMIDGLALGETTPGPLIMVVAFVGFVGGWSHSLFGGSPLAAGVIAAIVTTWFTFLPSFVFILAGGPLVESTHGQLRFTAPLAAITAAVVGVILNLALFFAVHVLLPEGASGRFEWPAALLGIAAGIVLFGFRVGVIPVILACGVAGMGLRLAGLV
jgi:chromate transporter